MTSRFTTAAARIRDSDNENQHANRQFQSRHKNCTVGFTSRNTRKRHVVFVKINPEMNVVIEIPEIQRTAHTLVRSVHLPMQNIWGVQGEQRYNSTHSSPRHQLHVNGQF